MHSAAIDINLWAACFLAEVALCFVLIFRGRWRTYLAFTVLIASQACADITIFLTYEVGSPQVKTYAYWGFVILNFPLQLAVVAEIVRVVLKPTGTWVRDAAKPFTGWAVGGAAMALVLAISVTPPTQSPMESMALRGNLFTSLLILELFVAITLSSNSLGLGWRNHVMALAQGLTAWSVINAVVDGLHSYLGERTYYANVDRLRSVAFLVALIYLIIQLWKPEPKRQPLSPELTKYISDLHDRVKLDNDTFSRR